MGELFSQLGELWDWLMSNLILINLILSVVIVFFQRRDPKAVRNAVLAEAQRLCQEGIDPRLWSRLKKAAYGSMVRRLNSLEDTCIELAQNFFRGEDYLNFPQCFQSIEWEDAKALLEKWCVPERVALSVICPVGTAGQERWG